jgi:TatD DNase family protein
MGFYIGITGWINDPTRGQVLRSIASQIPLSHLMIETDSPFLTPKDVHIVGSQGYQNQPAFVGRVAEVLAACHGVSVKKIIEETTANAQRVFALAKRL